MSIAVSVESTCDLTKELIEKFDISVVPYNIVLGDEMFKDGEKTPEELFSFVESTGVLPKTNALNEFEYTEYFENLRKKYDGVVHICLSSGITSSCGNAERASKNVDNVYVIDSRSLSTGIGLLAIYARELERAGEDIISIVKKVTDRIPSLVTTFIIEKLNYLFKGGRCNSLQLLGANILKLRPRIILTDGTMTNDKKYRGSMGAVIAKYATELFEEFSSPDKEIAFITYTTATEEMLNSAEDVCKKIGFKNIYFTNCGATVSSHCGEHTLGILFFNDGAK